MPKVKIIGPSGKTLSVKKLNPKSEKALQKFIKTFAEQVYENRGCKVYKPKKK